MSKGQSPSLSLYRGGVGGRHQVDAGRANVVGGAPAGGDAGFVKAAWEFGRVFLGEVARDYRAGEEARIQDIAQGVDAKFQAWRGEYEKRARGRDAANALADFVGAYGELAKEAEKEFDGRENEVFAGRLRRKLMAGALGVARAGGRYQLNETRAFEKSAFEGEIARHEALVAADPADADAVGFSERQVMESWRALNPGMDERAFARELAGRTLAARMDALLASDDLDGAERLLYSGGYTGGKNEFGANHSGGGKGFGNAEDNRGNPQDSRGAAGPYQPVEGGGGEGEGGSGQNPGRGLARGGEEPARAGRAWRNGAGPRPGSLSERNLSVYNYGNVKNLAGGFQAYASPVDGQMGILERLIRYHDDPKRRARTIFQLMSIYAPPKENNTRAYASFLAQKLGVSADAPVDVRDPGVQRVLLNGITAYEHGSFAVQAPEVVEEAIARTQAGQKPRITGQAPEAGQPLGPGLGGNYQGAPGAAGAGPGSGAGGIAAINPGGAGLALPPAKLAAYARKIRDARERLAHDSALASLQAHLSDTADLAPEARQSALYEYAASMPPQDRALTLQAGLAELDFQRKRKAAADAALAGDMLARIREQNLSPLDAQKLMAKDRSITPEASALVAKALEATRPNPSNIRALSEALAGIDSGILETPEERQAFALHNGLTQAQTSQLVNYDGNAASVTFQMFSSSAKSMGLDESLITPENWQKSLRLLPKGKKASTADLEKVLFDLSVDGKMANASWYQTFSSTSAFEAITQNQPEQFRAEVKPEEEEQLNRELEAHNLPQSPHNRMVLKTRAIMKPYFKFKPGQLDFER